MIKSERVSEGVIVVQIEPEDPRICQLCGAFSETRPYGPGGARVCFGCGMKNEEEAQRRFAAELINSVKTVL